MNTRAKNGIFKPRIFLTHTILKNISAALAYPQWYAVMKDDFQALQRNNTWTLVSLPPGREAIEYKWVFGVKENPDGSIQRYKARLVAKGFYQREGIDYQETFSPVIKPTTVCMILTLALAKKWRVQQIDINNAFLNDFNYH